MNKSVIIIGAGGHGKVIADIVRASGDILLGFLDDGHSPSDSVAGIPVLGGVCDYEKHRDAEFIIAIGNAAVREKIASSMIGVKWYTAIHPTAVLSTIETKIGEGSAIMANAVVNPCARVGKHCIINTSAVVEHNNNINDYAHISVGAKLAGTVTIGKGTWVGIGATVSNNITVCNDCMIGAGAVVVKDIAESGTYVGVPARKIK